MEMPVKAESKAPEVDDAVAEDELEGLVAVAF